MQTEEAERVEQDKTTTTDFRGFENVLISRRALPHLQVALADRTYAEGREELEDFCCRVHLLSHTPAEARWAAVLQHTHTQALGFTYSHVSC